MLDKIYDTYTQYRFDIFDRFENPKHLQVVIRITPEAYNKLRLEDTIYDDGYIHYIALAGKKTPLIISTDLPENVEFIIQSRADFERQEQEELLTRHFKMFGN